MKKGDTEFAQFKRAMKKMEANLRKEEVLMKKGRAAEDKTARKKNNQEETA